MNINEAEKWMKESLGKLDFKPNEGGWDKLQAALRPGSNESSKKRLLAFFPIKLKIAASIAILVSAGIAIYMLNYSSKTSTIARTTEKNSNTASKNKTIESELTKSYQSPTSASTQQKQAHIIANKTTSKTEYNELSTPASDSFDSSSTLTAPATESVNSIEHHITQSPKQPFDIIPELSPQHETARSHKINFGVAAQLGNASVGNMQYQVGVVAYRNISKRFYTRTTVAIASTDVSYSQENSFQSVSVNGFMTASVEEKTVNAQYGQNIISIGLMPNIGYRLTAHFALSCGFSIYRNLDQSLSLKNEEKMDKTAISNNIISDNKPISHWDAGLTGSVIYQANKRLAIDVQYRHGLSTYMHLNNQSLRNSGFGIGLNYLFGNTK